MPASGVALALTLAALAAPPLLPPGPGRLPIVVHSQFGGHIFGFDIDAHGSRGVLCEAQEMPDGSLLSAVETFDQRSGDTQLVSLVRDRDDFLALGVFAGSLGLIETEHADAQQHIQRSFTLIDPLASSRIGRKWTPPIDRNHLIDHVSRSQDSSLAAVYAYDNSGSFLPLIFSTDVATNTFGPTIALTDADFSTGVTPAIAYDSALNQAVLGIQRLALPLLAPRIAQVDLGSGATSVFDGVGRGNVNGIAVDPTTHRACTTTEIDYSVEFYDLQTQTGMRETLPGAGNQFNNGADVAVDTVHGLFLVAQPNSTTAPGTSSIHVYDEAGDLIESIDGFHFSDLGNVVPMHIALHPSLRLGFVDGPDDGVTQLEAFRY